MHSAFSGYGGSNAPPSAGYGGPSGHESWSALSPSGGFSQSQATSMPQSSNSYFGQSSSYGNASTPQYSGGAFPPQSAPAPAPASNAPSGMSWDEYQSIQRAIEEADRADAQRARQMQPQQPPAAAFPGFAPSAGEHKAGYPPQGVPAGYPGASAGFPPSFMPPQASSQPGAPQGYAPSPPNAAAGAPSAGARAPQGAFPPPPPPGTWPPESKFPGYQPYGPYPLPRGWDMSWGWPPLPHEVKYDKKGMAVKPKKGWFSRKPRAPKPPKPAKAPAKAAAQWPGPQGRFAPQPGQPAPGQPAPAPGFFPQNSPHGPASSFPGQPPLSGHGASGTPSPFTGASSPHMPAGSPQFSGMSTPTSQFSHQPSGSSPFSHSHTSQPFSPPASNQSLPASYPPPSSGYSQNSPFPSTGPSTPQYGAQNGLQSGYDSGRGTPLDRSAPSFGPGPQGFGASGQAGASTRPAYGGTWDGSNSNPSASVHSQPSPYALPSSMSPSPFPKAPAPAPQNQYSGPDYGSPQDNGYYRPKDVYTPAESNDPYMHETGGQWPPVPSAAAPGPASSFDADPPETWVNDPTLQPLMRGNQWRAATGWNSETKQVIFTNARVVLELQPGMYGSAFVVVYNELNREIARVDPLECRIILSGQYHENLSLSPRDINNRFPELYSIEPKVVETWYQGLERIVTLQASWRKKMGAAPLVPEFLWVQMAKA